MVVMLWHVAVQLNAIEARTVDGLDIDWYHYCCTCGHLLLVVKPAYCSLAKGHNSKLSITEKIRTLGFQDEPHKDNQVPTFQLAWSQWTTLQTYHTTKARLLEFHLAHLTRSPVLEGLWSCRAAWNVAGNWSKLWTWEMWEYEVGISSQQV